MHRYQNWIVYGFIALLIVTDFILLPRLLKPSNFAERKDTYQIAATVAAGIAVLGQFLIAGRNLAATERNIELSRSIASEKSDLDREGQITERFTRAVEGLGSDRMAIRLGGIYALERIARDSVKDYKPVMKVLVAFVTDYYFSISAMDIDLWRVREKLKVQSLSRDQQWALDDEAVELIRRGASSANDIRAIIEVIGSRPIEHEEVSGPVPLNFSGSVIHGLSFSGHYEHAGFFNSALYGTYFISTHLENGSFHGAVLEGVHFVNAVMDDVDFSDSNLRDVAFENIDLSRTRNLSQWNVDKCTFHGVCTLPPGIHWPGEPPPGTAI